VASTDLGYMFAVDVVVIVVVYKNTRRVD